MFALSARPAVAARPVAATRAVSARRVAAAPARALRASVVAKAEPKTPLEAAIEEAKDTCESGSSGECAVAWDTVSFRERGRGRDEGGGGCGRRRTMGKIPTPQSRRCQRFLSFLLVLVAASTSKKRREKKKSDCEAGRIRGLSDFTFPSPSYQ